MLTDIYTYYLCIGVRIGTPALTTRGMKEEHFVIVANFLHQMVQIGLEIQLTSGKLLKDFQIALENNVQLNEIKKSVMLFATQFPMPGLDTATMKYKEI